MKSLKTKLAGYREVTRFLYGHKTLGTYLAERLLRLDGGIQDKTSVPLLKAEPFCINKSSETIKICSHGDFMNR